MNPAAAAKRRPAPFPIESAPCEGARIERERFGASVSGFAGVLFASKQFFNPGVFSLQASFLVVTIVIFGGMGNRLGVVVGSVVLQGLAFYLRDKVPATDRYIWFGAVVIVMMIFRPQGVVPSRRRGREIKLAEQGVGHADALGSAPISEDLAS